MYEKEVYDVAIIGAGPAGLSTAIMCATRRLRILLLEKNKIGGLLTTFYPNKVIPNYPGFPGGVVALELVRSWLHHLRLSGVTVKDEKVVNVTKDLIVTTTNQDYRVPAVVAATGTRPRPLGIPNENRFSKNGKGVYYFPAHPEAFLRKKVMVVGGGDTAIDATLEVLNLADEITLVHRREAFRAFDDNVEKIKKSGIVNMMLNAELIAIKGRDRVETAVIKQGYEQIEMKMDTIIIAIGLLPNTEIFRELELNTDDAGFIYTDGDQRTNVEGVFAVGDVAHGGLRLISVASAHGAIASHYLYSYIRQPYWSREVWPTRIPQ